MANAKKVEIFVWSDHECEMLLRLTLEYKVSKLQQNVDWESCQSKYTDLLKAMQDQYPKEAAEDFPHDAMAITKSQLTSKLKNIRSKYRGAMDTGRRSGQGRVVMLFYELCQEIWGGSPAMCCIEGAMETDDLLESPGCSTPTMESPSPHSEESSDCLPPAVVKQRRHLLQAKLDSHRKDRLKRKARPDPVAEAEEDRQMKRRMVELAEESARSYAESTLQLNSNIANICSTIQDGLALMREIMYRPPQQTQYVPPHSGQYNSYPSPYIETTPRHTQHNATPMSQFAHTPSQTRTPGNIQDSYRRALLELDDVE
ncbi:uncharacterized protein LOC132473337 [Gadus macrocephalus]|uniref:uncharacterized protein LOC132473337 n=1 Tax=Gadus macrocephalus TaxID=80720 RepID=UPI0028CB3A2B|nr:uncharacterized protein LOC132473337 [Gadus macrocephalus]